MPMTGRSGRWQGEARVRSVNIVVWLYRTRPDQPFTARDVAEQFDISEADARRRIAIMNVAWGAVRPAGAVKAHRRGRRQRIYTLTAWGKKYAARAMRKGDRRAAANPRRKA